MALEFLVKSKSPSIASFTETLSMVADIKPLADAPATQKAPFVEVAVNSPSIIQIGRAHV